MGALPLTVVPPSGVAPLLEPISAEDPWDALAEPSDEADLPLAFPAAELELLAPDVDPGL